MRVGMMADLYKPHVSGVTNYISLNKRYWENQGHEVFVFTFGDESCEDDEPNVIRSPGLPISDTGLHFNFRYSRRANKLLRTMDVVHVQHPFISGSLAAGFCRRRAIPLVFTNHTRYDLYTQAYLPGVPVVFSSAVLHAYLPGFCRSCDMVIAPSAGMRDVLQGFGVEDPITVMPNGVDFKRFNQPVDPQKREDFGFNPENVILAYCGRLGPEKNLPFLLRAFAGTAQAYGHARLLVVGDGPELDNLKDRVRHMGLGDKVYFTGLVAYELIPSYLRMTDAFVTASVTEVHPLSVIEAMASGLPVLGIRSPGVGDTVEDKQTGFIVPGEDLASFTAMMVRLVVDNDLRTQMGQRARRAASQYDIERTSQQLMEAYRSVIDAAAPRKRRLRVRLTRWWDHFR